MPRKINVPDHVKVLIRESSVEGDRLILPSMDRRSYLAVNKVIEAIGGKWSKSKKVHIFPSGVNLQEVIDDLLGKNTLTTNRFDFFESPERLAMQMAYMAGVDTLSEGDICFDPNAGKGALLDAARSIAPHASFEGIEIDQSRVDVCLGKGLNVNQGDFLQFTSEPKYKIILINPPFNSTDTRNVFVEHIQHARSMLVPKGKMVSVVPIEFASSRVKKVKALHEMASYTELLPEKTFQRSGTNVRTLLATFTAYTYEFLEEKPC